MSGLQQHDTRIAWLDTAKALGIVLVVYGHIVGGISPTGILVSPIWQESSFTIYTFHMQLFFFLSGIGVQLSMRSPYPNRQPGAGWAFLQRRAPALILPYFVFALLQGGVQMALGGATNADVGLTDLLLLPIFPIGQFWFIYVLFLFTLLLTFVRPSLALLAVTVPLLLLSPLVQNAGWVFYQLMYFAVFFIAGCVLPVPKIPPVAAVVSVGVFAVMIWIAQMTQLRPGSPWMLPAALSGMTFVLFCAQKIGDAGPFLSWIGRNVIAIYVMHVFAGAGVRMVLFKLGVTNGALHVFIGTVAGVFLPLFALVVFQKLGIASLVGLPRGKSGRRETGVGPASQT